MSRKEKTKKEQRAELIAELIGMLLNYTAVKDFDELMKLNKEVNSRIARISILSIDMIEGEDADDR